MVFKRRNYYSRLNKWNICFTNCYKTYENLKFTISKFRNETKNMWIWKPLYEKSLTPPKSLTFRRDVASPGYGLWCLFLTRAKQEEDRGGELWALRRGEVSVETHTQILLSYLSYVHIFEYTMLHYLYSHTLEIKFQNRLWVRTP